MAHDNDVETDVARLQEIGALGAAFHMRRLVAENVELRRRVAIAEAAARTGMVPACIVDFTALTSKVEAVIDEFERVAPEIVRRRGACQGRHLRAVR